MKRSRLPSWTKAYSPGRTPGDPAELLSARLVAGIVDLLLVAVVIFTLLAIVEPAPLPWASRITLLVGGATLLALRRMVRTGRGRQAAIVLCVMGWLAVATDVPLHGQETVATGGFIVLVVIGGLAVGPQAAIALAVATAALMAAILLGLVPVTPIPVPGGGFRLTHYATQLSLAAALVAWWASHMRSLLLQVRTSEAQYTKLLEASPDAIVRVDASGIVTFCNGAVQRILGYAPEELVGRPWDAGPLLPGHIDALRQKFSTSLAGSATTATEVHVTHRDGRVVTMETKGYPIQEDDGRVVGVVAILRDVSERKRAEAEHLFLREQLVTAQRMEAIGRFAGAIAHDFNNMLTVVLNATEPPGDTGGAVDAGALADARDAAKRGANLTRQLLTFSRRQALPRTERTDLAKAASAIAPMLERLLGDAIKIQMTLDAAAPLVSMDHGQFDQILVNLVVNARDAMPKGGTVRIAVRALPAGPGQRRAVSVEVSDDGAGMSAETRERIFEPFFTTKGELGTGLGLAVVHGIVQGNGGSITVDSKPGGGTTFRIELPASDGDEESSSSHAHEASSSSA